VHILALRFRRIRKLPKFGEKRWTFPQEVSELNAEPHHGLVRLKVAADVPHRRTGDVICRSDAFFNEAHQNVRSDKPMRVPVTDAIFLLGAVRRERSLIREPVPSPEVEIH
jgi:hypothetical protein